MKMYVANYVRNKIEEIEVTRRTDKSIFIDCHFSKRARREAIKSSYCEYFDTYQEAKDAILKKISNKIYRYRIKYNNAIDELNKAYGEL